MEPKDYTYEQLPPDTRAQLDSEMTALLDKFDCDLMVTSNIQILRRVPKSQDGTEANTTEPKQFTTSEEEKVD